MPQLIPRILSAPLLMEVEDMKYNPAAGNGNCNSTLSDYSTRDYLELRGRVLQELRHSEIDQIGIELFRAYEEGRKVYLLGNGGSASLASHFACDLAKGTVTARNVTISLC